MFCVLIYLPKFASVLIFHLWGRVDRSGRFAKNGKITLTKSPWDLAKFGSVSEWVTNMNTNEYEREYEYEQIRNTNMYIYIPKMIDVLENWPGDALFSIEDCGFVEFLGILRPTIWRLWVFGKIVQKIRKNALKNWKKYWKSRKILSKNTRKRFGKSAVNGME